MQTTQKGFVIPLIVAIVVILAIIACVLVYENKKVEAPVVTNTSGEQTYTNSEYGFTMQFPASWKGYSVVNRTWQGWAIDGSNQKYSGPEILIKNPQTTTEQQYQDIPIMIFTHEQWGPETGMEIIGVSEHPAGFSVSAAPIGPAKIGENSKYFFATPPRWWGFTSDLGGEEAVNIVKTFKVTEPTSTGTTTNQTNLPIINNITPNFGPKGTVVTISGKNLSGFEGDLNVTFERADGKKILLTDTYGDYTKTGGNLINVKVTEPCQPGEKVIGEYSGIQTVCNYVALTPGTYKVYTEPWGVKSNVVNFTVTAPTSACTPNWTCGWGPCVNGYQGMNLVDDNNCPGTHAAIPIACPALARECTTTSAGENSFCGGIAGIQCASGLTCKYDGTYPDAGGKCIK